jgi:Mg-chelatase subunit ChlD
MKKSVSFVAGGVPACIIIIFLLMGCVFSAPRDSGLTGIPPTNENFPQPENPPPAGSTLYFYFSYDDSASTAAPELVKYQLTHGILPDKSLGRPWEFLNLESTRFDGSALAPFAGDPVFSFSMGLTKEQISGKTEWCLGAYIRTPVITKAERPNIVLTIVVDVSGSMGEMTTQTEEGALTKIELVKIALNQMLASLKAGDVVNIVTFSTTSSTVLKGAAYNGGSEFPAFQNVVNALEPTDSTNLNAGIQEAYSTAWSTFNPVKKNRVLILTDAYANTGEVDSTVIATGISHNNAEGIYFSGVGMGQDFNEAFLNELTEKGKGAYFSLVTRSDAIKAMGTRFIALVMVAARDVRFRLDYPAVLAHTSSASEESSTNPQDVQPTNFSYNTSQYFYEGFETKVAGHDPQPTDAFTLTISYKNPETGSTVTKTVVKPVADLLSAGSGSVEGGNIRDARVIFLLAGLVGGSVAAAEGDAIMEADYSGVSADASPITREYTDLIGRYMSLR